VTFMDPKRGSLVLVPNTLQSPTGRDNAIDVLQTLPLGTIREAARIAHWVVENAKAARAFLKGVDAVEKLGTPLQAQSIVELPRPLKGKPPRSVARPMDALIAPLLAGHDVGLLSEAGLPAVADPGTDMVAYAHESGIIVRVLSGPSAITLALAASGLNGQCFAFVGYLPADGGARAMRIRELESRSRREQQTQLAIETPYRNRALFSALVAVLAPTTRLSVSVGLLLPDAWSRTASVARWRENPPAMPRDVPAVFGWLAA